ncbi:MAG: S8 family serine peptidase, partial [Acidobacteriota bacterium]|nr:S8 family serine peptidase [Acidobacteriota bacterium]
VDRPLTFDFELPHGVVAKVPSSAVMHLAEDDRVFAVYGPPLHVKSDNAVAASLSHVTPLFSAPYNLTGNGVVLSLFELASADTTHPEFGGRFTSHVSGSTTGSGSAHPTHVGGTMIASGVDPRAKGMAPGATLQEFNALDDIGVVLDNKQNALIPLGVVADNNSWGYSIGWQPNTSGSGPSEVWWGNDELFGAYESIDSTPYDSMARKTSVAFVHSAGNDGTEGISPVSPPWFPHAHVNDNGDVLKETFCYSQNGSGTDCPTPTCSAGPSHCEIAHHATYGPFGTLGLLSALKNVISVGAVDSSGDIAFFSSRGPTRDGRVKPDIVAKGVSQFSTAPNNSYRRMDGTSMSSPVITGMMALFVEQWRKTFGGQNPDPETLKMLLIAGADDRGNAGPDYIYGFGLANAQGSVDLIRADANTGSRIRTGDISQGQQVETTLAVNAGQNVRVVLGWVDPDVFPAGDETASRTLVNDLDVKVVGPSGETVLPYVLDGNNPSAPATTGVNTLDNVEEIEIKNATAGTYRVIVTGKVVAAGPTQRFVLIANGPLATAAVCTDSNEPNDTPDAATGIASGSPVRGRLCSQTDVDYFKFTALSPGSAVVRLTATDTPVKVTLLSNGTSLSSKTIAAGATDSLTADLASIFGAQTTNVMTVRVEPAGTVGADASYTITATYPFSIPARHRPSRR